MVCSRFLNASKMQLPWLLAVPMALAGGLYSSVVNGADQAAGDRAAAPETVQTAAVAGSKLDIALGKSRMVNLAEPISRVAVGNPAVADVKILNRKQVWILGMGVGSTNLMLWDKAGNTIAAFDVNVNLNVEQLNDEIRKLVKGGDVRVRSVHDRVVLEGRVPDQETASSVVEIVEVFGHKNIVNLLKVDARPPTQAGQPAPEMEQIEIIRGTEMTTKQFKSQ